MAGPRKTSLRRKKLVRAAKGLAGVDGEFTALLWRLLVPYASAFRERFLRDGHISFDGLLVRARNLVRDQHARARRTQTTATGRS